MHFVIEKIGLGDYPEGLKQIPDVPESLYIVGTPLTKDALYLAVVGSRSYTTYGKDVCEKLIAGLAGSGIVIVSGLALGTDTNAHRAAMRAGLKTVAFPGSGLGEKVLYPSTNLSLAKEILANGGTLISELPATTRAADWTFPRRNRLMAGLCKATLVIEAADKSGTLITARLALDYNREVLAVPGPITSDTSFGPNRLIRQGATTITCSEDILEVFVLQCSAAGEARRALPLDLSLEEKQILELLTEPRSRDSILQEFDTPISELNSILSMMEIKGIIKEEFGEIRKTL